MTKNRREFAIALGCLGALGAARSRAQVGTFPKCFGGGPGSRVDIDAHCHVFNGSDLQVEKFLSLAAARELISPVRKLIELLAKPLQRSVWKRAPRAAQEIDRLQKFPSGANLAREARSLIATMQSDMEFETNKNYAWGFSEELGTPEGKLFLTAYGEYLDWASSEGPDTAQALADERAFELEVLASPQGLIQQLEREKRLASFSISSVFTFIRNFYAYRFEHCYYLLHNYGCEHGSIQLIAPALVDYDYPLGAGDTPTPSSLNDQFKVMKRIVEIFQGRVLPYLPFDPWRIVNGDDKAFRAAQEFISDGSAIGFKIYPPMGFAPIGNGGIKAPASWPKIAEFGKKLDQALGSFWDLVVKLDIPVIAHSAKSNAPYGDRMGLGEPRNWTKLFDKYPNARVCLGHFGGEELLDSSDQWTAAFLGRISTLPNVYGDLSYFENVLSRFKAKTIRRRLSEFAALPYASDKMIYGSDWEMLAIEAHSELYFEKLAQILAEEKYFNAEVAPKVFGLNAQAFLGLHRGQKSRMRLEAGYMRSGVEASWLKQIQ